MLPLTPNRCAVRERLPKGRGEKKKRKEKKKAVRGALRPTQQTSVLLAERQPKQRKGKCFDILRHLIQPSNVDGFIKHETNITSQNILTSVSAELNLKKIIKIYAEAGTNGNESAYGLGLKIPLLNGATTFYIPLLTEKGLIEFNNTEFIRYTFKLNLSDFSSML